MKDALIIPSGNILKQETPAIIVVNAKNIPVNIKSMIQNINKEKDKTRMEEEKKKEDENKKKIVFPDFYQSLFEKHENVEESPFFVEMPPPLFKSSLEASKVTNNNLLFSTN